MELLSSCSNSEETKVFREVANKEQLKSTYLVCRLGNGYFSNLFRKFASKEQKFSHIGILSIENDTVFVYHAEASELTGVGHVKREPLDSFLNEIKTYAFFKFNYSDSIKLKILDNVKNYYTKKTPFDVDFNSNDDSELYCTELIAVSVNRAVESNKITPSLGVQDKFLYTLDDIYLMDSVEKVEFIDAI